MRARHRISLNLACVLKNETKIKVIFMEWIQSFPNPWNKYIQGNPSVAELSDFLFTELEGSADVDKFLGLDFPKESVPNRSVENTPGWDLKDDITYDDIVELLGSNPTTEELLSTKKVQPQAN